MFFSIINAKVSNRPLIWCVVSRSITRSRGGIPVSISSRFITRSSLVSLLSIFGDGASSSEEELITHKNAYIVPCSDSNGLGRVLPKIIFCQESKSFGSGRG